METYSRRTRKVRKAVPLPVHASTPIYYQWYSNVTNEVNHMSDMSKTRKNMLQVTKALEVTEELVKGDRHLLIVNLYDSWDDMAIADKRGVMHFHN